MKTYRLLLLDGYNDVYDFIIDKLTNIETDFYSPSIAIKISKKTMRMFMKNSGTFFTNLMPTSHTFSGFTLFGIKVFIDNNLTENQFIFYNQNNNYVYSLEYYKEEK